MWLKEIFSNLLHKLNSLHTQAKKTIINHKWKSLIRLKGTEEAIFNNHTSALKIGEKTRIRWLGQHLTDIRNQQMLHNYLKTKKHLPRFYLILYSHNTVIYYAL